MGGLGRLTIETKHPQSQFDEPAKGFIFEDDFFERKGDY
jgi:hypothetical protein